MAEDESEWSQLSQPTALLQGLMVNDTRKGGGGRVIFSLAELPLSVKYQTPCGYTLQRISDNEVRYSNGGRMLYVKPLEELLGPRPTAARGTTSAPTFQQASNEEGEQVFETEQIIAAAERTAFKSHAAMQRMLQTTSETEQVGAATLETLHRQGEQIERIQDDLDRIDENHDRMEREMRSINSVGGQVLNMVTKPHVKARATNWEVDKKLDKDHVVRDKERAKQEKEEAKAKAKAEKKRRKKAAKKKAPMSAPPEEITDKLAAAKLPSELRVLSSEAQDAVIETDVMMDQLSSNLSNMKRMAVAMGDEISDQNKRLDVVADKVVSSDMRTRELEHRTRRMIK